MSRRTATVTVRRARQKGIVLPLTAISLFSLMAFAALSLDVSHLFLNKTRLQNAMDAAALGAAKTLDKTGDTVSATDAANDNFTLNLGGAGNAEMRDALLGVDPTVQFSATVNPFVPGSADGPYVRVSVTEFDTESWFAKILGMDEMTTGASAVAGPTPSMAQVCNILPVIVCGDPDGDGVFGYDYGEVATLKTGSKGNGDKGEDKFDVGPGNFQLLRLPGKSGASDIRDAMAGIGENCISPGDPLETEAGNTVGPAVQGSETRFESCRLGRDCAAWDIRPDMVTTEGISYQEYEQAYEEGNFEFPDPLGKAERRIAVAPIGVCTGDANGSSQVEFLGLACFFLPEQITQKGNEATLQGEFLEGCGAPHGKTGPVPNSGPGFYKIVLYKDTLSDDS